MLIALAMSGHTARVYAQGNGDYNNDGRVDGQDFLAFQSCMQGPGVPAATNCTVFDTLGNGSVDVTSYIGLMLWAADQASSCTPFGPDRRGFAGWWDTSNPLLIGDHAWISTHAGYLCAAGTTATTSVWFSVRKAVAGSPTKWAEVGYAYSRNFHRPDGTLSPTFAAFAEVRVGAPETNPLLYQIDYYEAPDYPESHYEERLTTTTGRWLFTVTDQFGFPLPNGSSSIALPAWINDRGTSMQWFIETFNKQDIGLGEPSSPLTLSSCEFLQDLPATSWQPIGWAHSAIAGNNQDGSVRPGRYKNFPPYNVSIQNATTMYIWDSR